MKSLVKGLNRFSSRLRKMVSGGAARSTSRKPAPSHLRVESLETRDVPSATLSTMVLGHTGANLGSVKVSGSIPSAPSFSLSAVSSSQVKISWSYVSNATSYVIDEWVNGAWKTIGTMNSSTFSATVSGLSGSSTYDFDVGAQNAYGFTWAANYQSITTPMNLTVNHPAAGGTYSNVNGSLFGAYGPVYTDVQQGAAGDCWLMASLAEVAARAPQDIRNMFTYLGTANENGVTVGFYDVRFFNNSGQATYVTVDTELPNGGGEYDHVSNGVLWVALAEKAYAEANGYRYVSTGSEGSDSYNALNGGDPSWALRAITGKSASDYSINPSNIATAWNQGKLVVIYTNSPVSPYIVPSHAYAVVGYNSAAGTPFTVYNPWGTNASGWALGTYNGHAVYGLFSANAAFLSQNFVAYSLGVGDTADGSAGQSQQASSTTNTTTTATPATMPTTVSNSDDSVWAFLGTHSHKSGSSVDYLADLLSVN